MSGKKQETGTERLVIGSMWMRRGDKQRVGWEVREISMNGQCVNLCDGAGVVRPLSRATILNDYVFLRGPKTAEKMIDPNGPCAPEEDCSEGEGEPILPEVGAVLSYGWHKAEESPLEAAVRKIVREELQRIVRLGTTEGTGV